MVAVLVREGLLMVDKFGRTFTISRQYPLVATAIAAVLSASGQANATPPSLAEATNPGYWFVIAGSSAAESSIAAAVGNIICGGAENMLTVQSRTSPETGEGSDNFFAFSCFPVAAYEATVEPSVVNVYYRAEGGSIVGALPIVNNTQIKRLNLSDTSCGVSGVSGTSGLCVVSAASATAGTQDGWTGAVTPDYVHLGITDVEPGKLTGANFPSNYSKTAFGSATPAQLGTLGTMRLYQQVFGLVVNTSGGQFLSPISLGIEAAANIMLGNYTDWNAVPNPTTGAPLTSTHLAITRVDTSPGTGTRAAANIFFLNYGCGNTNAIDSTGEAVFSSTADALTQANSIPGAITYTTIDQILTPSNHAKWPNLALVSIGNTAPSNLAAAVGSYGFWYEATMIPNEAGITAEPEITPQFAYSWLYYFNMFEHALLGPPLAVNAPDINPIPNYDGYAPSLPLTPASTGYVSLFTRAGNSCNVPLEQN
jgi:hypothetical protein